VRPETLTPGREPVVFFHGFLENHNYFDLYPGMSLAEYLAEKGFDCWVVDFRGAGYSDQPSLLDLDGWAYSVDDYIHLDAPAAIDHVLAHTGESQVMCVGHSMGGLTIYGYLAAEEPAKVKAAVTLAGAGKMGLSATMRLSTLVMFLAAMAAESKLPADAPFPTEPIFKAVTSPLLWPFFKYVLHGFLGGAVWQNANMTKPLIRTFLESGVGSISMNIAKQGLDWARYEDVYTYGPNPHEYQAATSLWFDAHGFLSYTDHLGDIDTPMLVCSGVDDQVMPTVLVAEIYAALGSPDKKLRVFAKVNGDSADYGHEDIVVGVHTPAEVYPEIAAWLDGPKSK
jgi:pimeloyl-ACP methyl ester carboxylesterase